VDNHLLYEVASVGFGTETAGEAVGASPLIRNEKL